MVKHRRQFLEYWEQSVPWTFKDQRKTYEERRRLRYELQDYMHDVIPFRAYRSKLLLEVGSGSGIDSAEFGRNGAEMVSVDFTENGVTTTRDTLKEAGLIPNVIRAAAQNLPFREDVFDCVYSFGVLHHIPDVRSVTKEISRLIKRDGELICMLYNRESLLYAYSILFLHSTEGLTKEELTSRYSERIEGCQYTKAYTKDEAIRIFDDDFHDITVGVHYNVIDLPAKRKCKLNIADEHELGWHMIVKAKLKHEETVS